MLSGVRLFVIPWTVARQAPLSMEFSRQEYWNGLPFPIPGDLPNPGIKPRSALQANSRPKSCAIPRISSPSKKIRGVHHTDGQLLITLGQSGQRGAHSRRMRNPLYSDKRRKPKKQQRRNIPAIATHAPPDTLPGFRRLFLFFGQSVVTLRISATPETAAHQAPPSMGFSC